MMYKQKVFHTLPILLVSYALIFIINYVNSEHHIYSWDYSNYWHSWINFHKVFEIDPLQSVKDLMFSIQVSDYNILPSSATSLFGYLNIPSRLSYILSISVMYIFPLSLIFVKIIDVFFNIKGCNRDIWSISLASSFLFPAFWSPTLRGLPDVGGLIFILISVYIVSKNDFTQRNIIKAVLLGLALWLAFVFRRWYVYTIVSLCISFPFFSFYLNSKENFKDALKSLLINYSIVGLVILFLLYFFQKDLVLRILDTNYSEIYSAYQGELSQAIYNLYSYIGGYIFFLILISTIVVFFDKNKKIRFFYIFCLFNLIFSFLLFTRTQLPGFHHTLPFALWCLCIALISVFHMLDKMKKWYNKKIFLMVTLFFLFGVHYYTFISKDSFNYISSLMPVKSLPLQINNHNEYLKLVADLNKLSKENNKIAVISSSWENGLNAEMLNSLSDLTLFKYLTYNSHVDLRDGLDINGLISANYFIVPDVPQLHLHESGQKVISLVTNFILERQNIGQALVKLPGYSYILGNGSVVNLYRKTRGFTLEEVELFLKSFYMYYPSWKNIYDKNLLKSYMTSNAILGDIWGAFYYDNGSIIAHSGENTPTTVEWYIEPSINLLLFNSIGACNKEDSINLEFYYDDKVEKYLLSKERELKVNVRNLGGEKVKLVISKGNSSACGAFRILAY